MPIDYKDYPENWKTEIVPAIRKRSGNRCEKCGVPNGIVIRKSDRKKPSSLEWEEFHRDLYNRHSGWTYNSLLKHYGFTKIVLTVAHIDHDKTNNDMSNLGHWCQKCHLTHDIHQHVENRKYGRNWKRDQLKLEFK